MRYLFLFFLLLLPLVASSTAYESGKRIYMQKGCFSCHGMKLEGLHQYPYLANRSKGYMTYKLKRFKSQISDNQEQEMMIAFAIGLCDEDIDNLTTYMNDYVEEKNAKRYDDKYKTEGDGGS